AEASLQVQEVLLMCTVRNRALCDLNGLIEKKATKIEGRERRPRAIPSLRLKPLPKWGEKSRGAAALTGKPTTLSGLALTGTGRGGLTPPAIRLCETPRQTPR